MRTTRASMVLRSSVLLALLVVGVAPAAAEAGVQVNETASNEMETNATETNATALDPSDWNVTIWRGHPSVRDRLTDVPAIQRARASGALTRNSTLLPIDTLVLELHLPGLDRWLAGAEGPNETARFFEATHGPNSAVSLQQVNHQTNLNPLVGALNQTNATRVVIDGENDTYFLVVNATAVRFERDSPRDSHFEIQHPTSIQGDETWELNVTLDSETRVFGPVPTDPLFETRAVDFETGTARWGSLSDRPASANRTVNVSGDFYPGVNATLRIDDRSDAGPALSRTVSLTASLRTDAQETGRLSRVEGTTTMDLSGFANGTTFDVTLSAYGWDFEYTPGTIRLGSPRITLHPRQGLDDGRLDVRQVVVDRRGFLIAQPGPWRGLRASERTYRQHDLVTPLDPGRNENLTVAWSTASYIDVPEDSRSATVVAVADVNDNGEFDDEDRLMTHDGAVIGASVRHTNETVDRQWNDSELSIEPTATPTEPTTPTSTASPTRSPTTTPTSTESPPTTDETGPGFGILAALCGALALIVLGGRD